MLFIQVATLLALATSALAGQNCKCQANDGTGQQFNEATAVCCDNNCTAGKFGTLKDCFPPFTGTFPGPNNQCSAGGSNCIDSGAFVRCCKSLGAPGAFCWG